VASRDELTRSRPTTIALHSNLDDGVAINNSETPTASPTHTESLRRAGVVLVRLFGGLRTGSACPQKELGFYASVGHFECRRTNPSMRTAKVTMAPQPFELDLQLGIQRQSRLLKSSDAAEISFALFASVEPRYSLRAGVHVAPAWGCEVGVRTCSGNPEVAIRTPSLPTEAVPMASPSFRTWSCDQY
jgi:hypothetical protein